MFTITENIKIINQMLPTTKFHMIDIINGFDRYEPSSNLENVGKKNYKIQLIAVNVV